MHDTIHVLHVPGHNTEHFGSTICLLFYFWSLCSKLCGPGSDCSRQNCPTWTQTLSRSLALCLLGKLSCFFSSSADFFPKSTVSKNPFRNTIWVSNKLDSDRVRRFVGPDLDPVCLQILFFVFVRFDSLSPINNLSVIKGRIFLG